MANALIPRDFTSADSSAHSHCVKPRISPAKFWLLAVALGAVTFTATAAAQGGADAKTTDANKTAVPLCMARSNIRRMQIVDAQNIVFVMRDKTTYRNSLAKQCPALRRNSQISLTPADGRVCTGTSFQVLMRVNPGTESVMVPGGQSMSVSRPSFVPGPTCFLGPFTAVTQADVDALVESSKARRRDEPNANDEAEGAPQPAAPEAR